MTRRILLLLVLLGIGLPASAQKVYIDYDREYDRSEVKTFRWKKTDDTSLAEVSPFLHSQIVNGIEYYLHLGGLREVEADPDVFVTYHTSSKEEMSINTDHYGYGYGGGWYRDPRWYGGYGYGGMTASQTYVATYERGTLVIDVWDRRTEKIIWRGSATDIIPQDPQKVAKKIDRWLKKIIATWEKLKDQESREKKKAAKRAAREQAKGEG